MSFDFFIRAFVAIILSMKVLRKKRGYIPKPDLMTTFQWLDIGEQEETENL